MSEPMTNNKFNPWPMTEPAYTEQDLREAEEATGHRIDIGLPRPYDSIVRRVATRISRIRSEARAGMREACATAAIGNYPMAKVVQESIRQVTDLAADEAIERIKREARLEEAKWWQEYMDMNRDYKSAPDDPGPKRIAELTAAARKT